MTREEHDRLRAIADEAARLTLLAQWRYTHFACYARNGRWGTCGDCKIDLFGMVYPEFCENTNRYDHKLDLTALVEQFTVRGGT